MTMNDEDLNDGMTPHEKLRDIVARNPDDFAEPYPAPQPAQPNLEVVAWQDGEYLTTSQECAKGCIPLTPLADAQAHIAALTAKVEKLEREARAWAAQLHHAETDRDFNEKCRAEWQDRAEALEAQLAQCREAGDALGWWLSAALEDENVSPEMKVAINNWFASLKSEKQEIS